MLISGEEDAQSLIVLMLQRFPVGETQAILGGRHLDARLTPREIGFHHRQVRVKLCAGHGTSSGNIENEDATGSSDSRQTSSSKQKKESSEAPYDLVLSIAYPCIQEP